VYLPQYTSKHGAPRDVAVIAFVQVQINFLQFCFAHKLITAMRAMSAVSALGVATATSFIAVDYRCTDPSTGCNGGCYQWEGDEVFFYNCMQDRSPVVMSIMKTLVILPLSSGVQGCSELGFVPLTQSPDGSPIPGGSSAPDGCYGGAGSRVSFFATDQKWFWDTTLASGFNPPVDCPQWQAENPQCFDHLAALV